MKIKFYQLLAGCALFSASFNSFAQSGPQTRSCSSMEMLAQQLKEDPAMLQRRNAIEAYTQKSLQNNLNQRTRVITIPVVVHVVYNTAAQNISDAQIQSQIAVLNKDFRKLNPDVSQVPGVWSGLAADAQIEFCLAKR